MSLPPVPSPSSGSATPAPAPGDRRIGVADVMILIAAIAVGAGLNRAFPFPRPLYWRDKLGISQAAYWVILPHLWAFTVAGLVIQWRGGPRGARPGLAACAAATAGVALTSIKAAGLLLLGRWGLSITQVIYDDPTRGPGGMLQGQGRARIHVGLWEAVFLAEADLAAYLVLGAWLAVLLGGGWGRAGSWRERLGRGIGGCWLAVAAYQWLFYMIL